MNNNEIFIDILLVEDNAGDACLFDEALKECKAKVNLFHVVDGIQATRFLNKQGPYVDAPTPNLIFMDFNLPKKSGLELLREIKTSEDFKFIPVIILSVSQSQNDIQEAYRNFANCYISKPIDFDQFDIIMHLINDFWFNVVKLPLKTY